MESVYEKLGEREQKILEYIYKTRDFPKGIEDAETRLEWLAHEYHNQLKAFSDVLLNQDFEVVTTVDPHYAGDIAAISMFGTVVMLSKPVLYLTRKVTSSRIYRPEIEIESENGVLSYDAALKKSLDIDLHTGSLKSVKLSPLRGLAIKLNGEVDQKNTFMQMRLTYRELGKTTLENIFGIKTDSC